MNPRVGLMEWFRPGDYQRVETVIEKARALGIKDIRTCVSWADWHSSEGDGWYAWLLPRLASEFTLLPCFLYTPPSLGIAPKFSSPPRNPKSYADFIDIVITRFGSLFEWLELWNNPNDPAEWDTRIDVDWEIFSEMVGVAACRIRKRGKKVVLPCLWPSKPGWFELMSRRGVLSYVDAVGIHGFPSIHESGWRGWKQELGDMRISLECLGANPQIWITEAGFSTWRSDEELQVTAFAEAMNAGAERVYWRELFDKPSLDVSAGFIYSDERANHYGLLRNDSSPKLLFQLWSEGGLRSVVEPARFVQHRRRQDNERRALITGGAGFIGTNLAERLVNEGYEVTIYDNLSRPGVDQNVEWLRETFGSSVSFENGDVRDAAHLKDAVQWSRQVFHFAAQVAVTTSLIDPRQDYEINLGGTINLLEALRSVSHPPPLIFTSTNKVYGALPDLSLERNCTRYRPLDPALRSGISEARPLDFHSPYGCSKGAADQYVLDYARTYGIPAVVFRMSCIYGPHQMGTEDQGWIAHFMIKAIKGEQIVIYGDGMQVRDVLFVDDLVDAFLLAQANCRTLSGQAFNIGGGLGNTISLLELLELIASMQGRKPQIRMEDWRTGDQRYYVSDTRKFKAAAGWGARVSVQEGVRSLYKWLEEWCGDRTTAASRAGGGPALLAN